jgi:hypothetical protein
MARAGNRNYTLNLQILLLQHRASALPQPETLHRFLFYMLQSSINRESDSPLKAFCNLQACKIAANK